MPRKGEDRYNQARRDLQHAQQVPGCGRGACAAGLSGRPLGQSHIMSGETSAGLPVVGKGGVIAALSKRYLEVSSGRNRTSPSAQ
jgi:hypothetical protein